MIPSVQIAYCAKDYDSEFQKILLLRHRQSSVSVPEKRRQIPSAGFCKLNFDGSLNMSSGTRGVGMAWCVIQWAVSMMLLHCMLPVCCMS